MSEQVEVSQPKFELTDEQKTINGILYTRIRAIKDFADVKAGDLGGWMDKATFLSDTGNCWVYDNAIALGSFLYDDATITDEAFVRRSTLRNDARVSDHAVVTNSELSDSASVMNRARVTRGVLSDNASAKDYSTINQSTLLDDAVVSGRATVEGHSTLRGHVLVSGAARITDGVDISDVKVMRGTVNPDVFARLSIQKVGDKYALTNDTLEYEGRTLRRIKALKSFGDVRAGEMGGYIESPTNLSSDGDCWVADSAKAMDNARVMDDVLVRNEAVVKDNAQIGDNALIDNNAIVSGNAIVGGDSQISDRAHVTDDASVVTSYLWDDSVVSGHASLAQANLFDSAIATDSAVVEGTMRGETFAGGRSHIHPQTILGERVYLTGDAVIGSGVALASSAYIDSGVVNSENVSMYKDNMDLADLSELSDLVDLENISMYEDDFSAFTQ